MSLLNAVISQSKRRNTVTLWTPSETSTAFWYDALDASTVIESSGVVSQWQDKSGNAYNLIQSVSSQRPTYEVTGWDGAKPTISFDATNRENLRIAPINMTLTQPLHVFVAVQFLTKADRSVVFDSGDIATPFTFYNGDSGEASYRAIVGASGQAFGSSDFLKHQFYVRYEGTLSQYGIDGSTPSSITLGTDDLSGMTVGEIRNLVVTAYGFTGRISEMIAVQGSLLSANRELFEGYLAGPDRWDLQANLPVSHPYKSNPPTI